jgi:hypothetical protein
MDLNSRLTPRAKMGLTALLGVFGMIILRDPGRYHVVDSVDLWIHEAGHVFFGFFGGFITALGGTLLQLIVPLTFMGYFLRQRERHAASVMLWWVAENLWNISVYVKDARAQELPLIGGGGHDWAYILSELGLLRSDLAIGRAIHATGLLLFFGSIVWGLFSARAGPPPSEPSPPSPA